MSKWSWDLDDEVQAALAKEALDILIANRTKLHAVLRRFDAYRAAEPREPRRRAVDEFLMLMAENAGVSSDLVRPGSHRHRLAERARHAENVRRRGLVVKSPNPFVAPNLAPSAPIPNAATNAIGKASNANSANPNAYPEASSGFHVPTREMSPTILAPAIGAFTSAPATPRKPRPSATPSPASPAATPSPAAPPTPPTPPKPPSPSRPTRRSAPSGASVASTPASRSSVLSAVGAAGAPNFGNLSTTARIATVPVFQASHTTPAPAAEGVAVIEGPLSVSAPSPPLSPAPSRPARAQTLGTYASVAALPALPLPVGPPRSASTGFGFGSGFAPWARTGSLPGTPVRVRAPLPAFMGPACTPAPARASTNKALPPAVGGSILVPTAGSVRMPEPRPTGERPHSYPGAQLVRGPVGRGRARRAA